MHLVLCTVGVIAVTGSRPSATRSRLLQNSLLTPCIPVVDGEIFWNSYWRSAVCTHLLLYALVCYVCSNVSFDSEGEDLKEAFKQFGDVQYARIVVDPETEHSRGS